MSPVCGGDTRIYSEAMSPVCGGGGGPFLVTKHLLEAHFMNISDYIIEYLLKVPELLQKIIFLIHIPGHHV